MVDYVKVYFHGGDGGDGAISFRREKFIPKGGPDGGDGGKGGNVIIQTDPNMTTLEDFTQNKVFRAGKGEKGHGKQMFGSKGEDITIRVPVGTIMKLKRIDKGNEEEKFIPVAGFTKGTQGLLKKQPLMATEAFMELDLSNAETEMVIAKGGKGGKGNVHFKGAAQTTPLFAEAGQMGQSFEVEMELKLLADIALVGLPNAGKSTLLSILSNARPKIADYPFTTLEPNLGVMRVQDKGMVLADIPGLIEGASEGKGLGIKFLRHIERTRILVHIVAINPEGAEATWKDYLTVRGEMEKYSPELAEKPEIVVINKIDLYEESIADEVVKYFDKKKIKVMPISCGSKINIEKLKNQLLEDFGK